MKTHYDVSFYEEQSPFSINSAQKVVPYLSELIPHITSVVDIGCGVGGWLHEWKQDGKEILGIDGNDLAEKDRKISNSEYIKHDLNQQLPKLQKKYDLCMSLEVAEHLPPERAASFINDLCSYSDTVLFSAAIPGQTGINHINEQWPQYWADLFLANGFKSYDILRNYFWNDTDIAWWYAQNMILYSRTPLLHTLSLIPVEQVLPYVHPKCFSMYYPQKPPVFFEELSYKQMIIHLIKKIALKKTP